jgi:plastocyanin
MKITGWLCALALSAGFATMSFAQVTGKVTLMGKPPEMAEIAAIKVTPGCAEQHKNPVYEEKVVTGEKGELANVAVYIKTPEGKTLGKPLTTPAVLDQIGCIYHPHVIALTVGQPLIARNSDAFLHNVHTLPFDNAAVNIGQPNKGEKTLEPFKAVETFKVKCDIHPWMAAWIVVLDNPYFAVSSADPKTMGTFSIDTKGLPDGEYTFIAWQEVYGEQPPVKVKVTGGKAEVNFTIDAAKKASAAPFKQIKLAMTGAAACCAGK